MSEGYLIPSKVKQLLDKGVTITNPLSVEISEEVRVDMISSSGVVLHNGTKLYGEKTLICEGTQLGYETPATIVNCQIGRGVNLKGGFFQESTFLDGVQMASGAHVRQGCILEEETRTGHTVGLKHTILFPFVTLGSLINFCDCLMSGGTDSKNHSEVGSSYIHFNYTPNQDKATASLIGDVPTGVMLDQPPIFLGGQGGIVGPVRIGHGTVIAAGTVWGKDCPEGGKLLKGLAGTITERAFNHGAYGDVARKTRNNILYVAHLIALKQWYRTVRVNYFKAFELGPQLCSGAIEKLDMAIKERIKRLGDFIVTVGAQNVKDSSGMEKLELGKKVKNDIADKWPEIQDVLKKFMDQFAAQSNSNHPMESLDLIVGDSRYVDSISALSPETKIIATAWLQGIVDMIVEEIFVIVPQLRS